MQLDTILEHLAPGKRALPEDFIHKVKAHVGGAYYLISCAYGEKVLYVSPSFQKLTGYALWQFQQGGIGFWFPLIHPLDLATVTKVISQAHVPLAAASCDAYQPSPLVLEYRLKKANGEWIWIQEAKWVIEFTAGGTKDKILGFLEDISERKSQEEQTLQQLLQKEAPSHTLLKAAVKYQRATHDPLLFQIPRSEALLNMEQNVKLTRREKEVLVLIADGLNTKEIAEKLFISDNTVETHRRHLLQKFGVKNAAELIRQASKMYWPQQIT